MTSLIQRRADFLLILARIILSGTRKKLGYAEFSSSNKNLYISKYKRLARFASITVNMQELIWWRWVQSVGSILCLTFYVSLFSRYKNVESSKVICHKAIITPTWWSTCNWFQEQAQRQSNIYHNYNEISWTNF